jgi:hypothetical protein
MQRFARFFIAALVGAGFLAAAPAVTASASSGVQVIWVSLYTKTTITYGCSSGAHSHNGDTIQFIANSCGDRAWLHQYTTGGGGVYCVNPGAVASGFPQGYEQFQTTATPSICVAALTYVTWSDMDNTQYNCIQGATHTASDQYGNYYYINNLVNRCNVRLWLHYNANGTGAEHCVTPYGKYSYLDDFGFYSQLQISANQAPC